MPRIFSAKVIICLLALLALDVSIIPFFRSGAIRPVFIYLMIPFAAFEWHWTKTLPMSMTVGILRDLISAQAFGTEVLALGIAAVVLNFLVQKVSAGSSSVLRLFATLVFVFSAVMIQACFDAAFITASILSWKTFSAALGCAFFTSLLMPLFFAAAKKWFGKVYATTSLGY